MITLLIVIILIGIVIPAIWAFYTVHQLAKLNIGKQNIDKHR